MERYNFSFDSDHKENYNLMEQYNFFYLILNIYIFTLL